MEEDYEQMTIPGLEDLGPVGAEDCDSEPLRRLDGEVGDIVEPLERVEESLRRTRGQVCYACPKSEACDPGDCMLGLDG